MNTDQNFDENKFGGAGRYYSTDQPDSARLYGGMNDLERTLTETLLRRYPDINKTVERTYRRWNLTVREILRTETGLRLSVGENRQVVSVRVVDGLPLPFTRIFQQAPNLAQWELALHQPLLVGTQSGLAYIKKDMAALSLLVGETQPPYDEIETIYGFVNDLVDEARRFNLLKAILSIEEDTLGAYFYRYSTVHLYWLPIGITANLLGVSVEALTVVILAHELAHAYTHLGLDIDGNIWPVDDFAYCNIGIVEGLAQFYALEVCEKIKNDYPYALETFDKLLQQQPAIYRTYADWIEDFVPAGELIRHCLIRTRTQRIMDYQSFLQEIANGKKLLQRATNKGKYHG